MKKIFIALLMSLLLFPGFLVSDPVVINTYAADFLDGMQVTDDGTFNPGKANNDSEKVDYNGILGKYKGGVRFFTALLTITSFACMIWNISKLAMAGDDEQARKRAMIGILFCGIGIALMGSSTLVISIFWNAI